MVVFVVLYGGFACVYGLQEILGPRGGAVILFICRLPGLTLLGPAQKVTALVRFYPGRSRGAVWDMIAPPFLRTEIGGRDV
uniref:Uncharacterized protein n=1 Tax=Magnetospirillum gryphiswaldense TaxID=55518 RepID=A4U3Y5_9PROT|nr:hypothetical protein MGR_0368 [Magnetospirillum gryphiswaldense MSR-1]